ncbi:YhcB family protein [Actinomadura terrae]|uniref:YhcB family protein n=1 Tax=Actinomadura terrae TaxID=604353 RepID=UPI001FA7FD8E|nr:YhcB family protein [Actinomadura terrae]
MTTTTSKPPGSAPQPRARPERRSRKRRPAGTAPAAPAQDPARDEPAGTATRAPSKTPSKAAATKTKAAPAKAPAKSTPSKGAPSKSTPKAAPAKAAPATSARKKGAGRAARRRAAAHTPPRAPFVLLIVGLLGGALVSLLLLNTVLAKDAFTLTRLQQSNKLLEQQRQAYQADIAAEGSPESLANRAEKMGMVKQTEAAFVDGRTGRTSGARVRPVPHSAAASASAASMLGIPGTIVPGDPRAVGAPAGTGAP